MLGRGRDGALLGIDRAILDHARRRRRLYAGEALAKGVQADHLTAQQGSLCKQRGRRGQWYAKPGPDQIGSELRRIRRTGEQGCDIGKDIDGIDRSAERFGKCNGTYILS